MKVYFHFFRAYHELLIVNNTDMMHVITFSLKRRALDEL